MSDHGVRQSQPVTDEQLCADVVVAHRLGFWGAPGEEVTPEMVAIADEELERYVQLRVTHTFAQLAHKSRR